MPFSESRTVALRALPWIICAAAVAAVWAPQARAQLTVGTFGGTVTSHTRAEQTVLGITTTSNVHSGGPITQIFGPSFDAASSGSLNYNVKNWPVMEFTGGSALSPSIGPNGAQASASGSFQVIGGALGDIRHSFIATLHDLTFDIVGSSALTRVSQQNDFQLAPFGSVLMRGILSFESFLSISPSVRSSVNVQLEEAFSVPGGALRSDGLLTVPFAIPHLLVEMDSRSRYSPNPFVEVEWTSDITYDFALSGTLAVMTSPVPEPQIAGLLLAGIGLLGFDAARRRRVARRPSP